ncbi:MAG: S26 family signal peptidase [Dictyoglomus turgidum]
MIAIGVCLLGWAIASHLVIAMDKSVDKTLFFRVNKEPSLGDFVVVQGSNTDPVIKGRKIVKRVTCLGGQHLVIKQDYYFCGDTYIGKALHKTYEGNLIEPFNPCKADPCEVVIPQGYYFLTGTHPRSYDSRYVGFFKRGDIVYVVKALF